MPSYSYVGITYANPHAPTGIWLGYATSTLVYDANGNVTQYGTTTAYTYDYRNRMNAAGVLGATSTYAYDHTQQRMRQTLSNGTRTDYPSKFYSITSTTTSATTTATSTAYIWQGDTMVAYIEQLLINGVASGTPRMHFTHPDHLGSTNVVTNASGTVVQTLDYYPYGSVRIDSGSADSARKFIGQFADDPTALSYLNARYYDPGRAGFLSQDPTHLAVGDPRLVAQLAGQETQKYLSDPQLLNSYSYARGNPVVAKDPSGNSPLVLGGGTVAGTAYGFLWQAEYDRASGQRSAVSEYVKSGAWGGVQGFGLAAGLVYAGPSAVLEGLSYYDSYQGLRDFNEQVLSKNSPNYTERQQRITSTQVWMDAVQRIMSPVTPPTVKGAYNTLHAIIGSLIQIQQQLNSIQGQQRSSTQQSPRGGSLPSKIEQNGVTYVRNSSGLLNIAK